MGEYHCPDQAKSRGEARSQQRGNPCEDIGPKENQAQLGRCDTKPQIKPIRGETLYDEAARERI